MRYRLFITFGILILTSCSGGSPESTKPASDKSALPGEVEPSSSKKVLRDPLAQPGLKASALPAAGVPSKQFVEVPGVESGLDFMNVLKPENNRKYLNNGSGTALGDYDGDGRVDIYFCSTDGTNSLYRQTGPLTFENVTAATGTAGLGGWSTGASFADVDRDGDLDLYVTNLGTADLLYINQGDGTFKEGGAAAGLAHIGAGVMPSFADFDRDGDLDLYLLTNRVLSAADEAPTAKLRLVNGRPTVHPDYLEHYTVLFGKVVEAGQRDHLYRNNGDGTFTDVSTQSGIAGYDMGLSATWTDYDNDGWPDLYVANDLKTPDHLYKNKGDGTFVDVLPRVAPHSSWFSMGADAGDIDGDGEIDLVIADMSTTDHYKAKTTMGNMGDSREFLKSMVPAQYPRNTVLLSSGTRRFQEAAFLAGLASTDWTWTVRIADLDADGHQDVFFTNGHARNANDSDVAIETDKLLAAGKLEEADQLGFSLPPLPESNRAYRNLGGLQFEDFSEAWGLAKIGVSHSAAVADLDRDGDLDVVLNNLNEKVTLYRNEGTAGNRVTVQLQGKKSNAQAVGARVEIEAGGKKQVREVFLARGYMTSEDTALFFGLGAVEKIESMTVHWPSGAVQRFLDLPANHAYSIQEGTPPAGGPTTRTKPDVKTWFSRADRKALGLTHRHKERSFDDYDREPLLPNALSTMGPGVVVADLDRDGNDELFLGGPAGASSQLFSRRGGSGYAPMAGPWAQETEAEDMGGLVFDANGDGREDLFVLSGGVEASAGSETYRDRLFLATEAGFKAAPPSWLPSRTTSSSAVAAADFDRDGDLDLFVGGGSKSGEWPTAEPSYLLQNTGTGFRVTGESVLAGVGLVRGARWADIDDDGWQDLVVATEWGPIRLLRNEQGSLADVTEEWGLAGLKGWWHGVEAGDLDGDGDLDLVATNFGLNSKYHANEEHPTRLHVTDFDGDGDKDVVEADWQNGTEYPIRGLSCSSGAIPVIGERFETFDSFARADLGTLYGKALDEAEVYEANHLAHTVFLNEGGRFTASILPRRAQISVAWGLALVDFDGDAKTDIYLTQNWFAPQPETGRMDGGLGQLLRGNGDGTFEVVSPGVAGVVDPADSKGIAVSDLNRDGRPDIMVGRNRLNMGLWLNEGAGTYLSVNLAGKSGNQSGIGSRVTLTTDSGRRSVAEVSAGGGYLSQSPARLWFGLAGERAVKLEVRWPDGSETVHEDLPAQGGTVIARQGDS